MKLKIITGLLVFSWILAIAVIYLHKGQVQLVRLPPASLAKWYKPQSERHVWLHTMFNLRREMQAIEYYANNNNATQLAKWTTRLNGHYQEIAEMVPRWSRRLDFIALDELIQSQQANQFEKIPDNLERLQQSCDSCHDQFRSIAAVLYRAPEFTELTLNSEHDLSESMAELNVQVNDIKIAIEAEDSTRATRVLDQLRSGIDETGTMCVSCHEHLEKTYPDASISAALDDLALRLESGTQKQQGQALGMLAVTACAQCHGTHRIAYDTRKLLSEKPGLIELFRH